MKKKILFVCLGNICRSPAAEEIFRQLAARRGLSECVEADSAGTYGGHAGELPVIIHRILIKNSEMLWKQKKHMFCVKGKKYKI